MMRPVGERENREPPYRNSEPCVLHTMEPPVRNYNCITCATRVANFPFGRKALRFYYKSKLIACAMRYPFVHYPLTRFSSYTNSKHNNTAYLEICCSLEVHFSTHGLPAEIRLKKGLYFTGHVCRNACFFVTTYFNIIKKY